MRDRTRRLILGSVFGVIAVFAFYTVFSVWRPAGLPCHSVSQTTPERTPECISLIQNEVGETLNQHYGRWIITPAPAKYYFWTEAKSEAYREINQRQGALGYSTVYDDGSLTVTILYPTKDFDLPVELVIAHEIVHLFQVTNKFDIDELQARDISMEAWLHLFYTR